MLPKPYYQDDAVTIYNADCRDILPGLPDGGVELIVTDPPYNFESEGGGFYGNWHGNGHEPRNYIRQLVDANCVAFDPKEILDRVHKITLKYYGYFFCNKELVSQYVEYAKFWGYMFDILVMAKYNPIPACNSHHLHDLEYVVMMRQSGTTYYKSDNFDDNRKFYLSTCDGSNLHPAEKPEPFIQRMITVSSKYGNTILDPFLGSGTTAFAAKKLGRKCIGIEIEERYCEIAAKRCSQMVMELKI